VGNVDLGEPFYVITEACIDVKSRACVDVLPVDCIHGGEDDHQLFINPAVSLVCGACEAACPVQTIYLVNDLRERLRPFVALNAARFESKA
jgi:NAD-dependent dihydropyrimidine dehydrogenase PreA subunit